MTIFPTLRVTEIPAANLLPGDILDEGFEVWRYMRIGDWIGVEMKRPDSAPTFLNHETPEFRTDRSFNASDTVHVIRQRVIQGPGRIEPWQA